MNDENKSMAELISELNKLRRHVRELGVAEKKYKQTEKALRESEGKLDAMLRAIPDHMSMMDKDLNIIWANETARALFGEDIVGKKCYRTYHGREQPCEPSPCLALQAFQDGQVHEHDTEVVGKDDRKMCFHCTASVAIRNEDGTPMAVMEISRNITEHNRAEEALRKYQSMVESAHDAIFFKDMEGRYVIANDKTLAAFGLPREEVIGKTDFEIMPNQDEAKRNSADDLVVFETGKRTEIVKHMTGSDGKQYWFEAVKVPEFDSHGNILGLIGIARDVTERKQFEEQLHQAQKMEAIGQLAGGIAHDFNNQLVGIMGYADMLVNKLKDETLKSDAEAIVRASKRAADMTQQLLAFARKGKFLSGPVDIHKIITEVATLLKHSLHKRITIEEHLKANPCVTTGDPTQLQNALLNIAINAADAMPQGGEIVFETEVVTLDKDFCAKHAYDITPGRYVHVRITDNGVGMDEKTQKHVFEPFFTTKEQGQGTGMGLAAVYGTIKNHQGAIDIYSEVGSGTTFNVYLPLSQAVVEEFNNGVTGAAPVMGTAHILVVDDEAVVRKLATRMLESFGYKVDVCADGAEGVEYYRKAWKDVDLVIIDMIMPKLDGRNTFIAMREINPKIKVILSSGYGINAEAQGILDEGVQRFLQKPFHLASLSRMVAEVLGQ